MDQKHYLFYQKQSIGTFWKNSFHLEKFFLICFLLFSLFMQVDLSILPSAQLILLLLHLF